MRGENLIQRILQQNVTGSPPHARGKSEYMVEFEADRRITPACAGKIKLPALADLLNWDHPRMRGENT